jgi:2-polyprenyl-6-methoxyphenol hydroxylase-like FAD-dependent oxidoreductase
LSDYDVIVVGSRVAGSILAASLGELGHTVLLLDRARFPSDTLSTHFFRAPALRAFRQVGILEGVLGTAPRMVVDYNVVDGIVFPEPVDSPDDYPFYLCVRRITLDDLLVNRVRKAPQVELHEGAVVESLIWEAGRCTGVRWREAGDLKEARARAIVGADGLRSTVVKQVSPLLENTEPVNRAMYYAYYRDLQPMDGPAAEFHYRGNRLVYVFPCDGELTLVATSVPIGDFPEFKRSPQSRFQAELEAMPQVSPRLKSAVMEGPLRGTGSIPGYLRVPYGPGWALVGDSAMVMDPWSGQGIDQASTHALFLADALHAYLGGETGWEAAMQGYHTRRNEFSEKTYRRTCTFGRNLRPMTRKALERRGLV